jgi:hypothetical protein
MPELTLEPDSTGSGKKIILSTSIYPIPRSEME